MSRRQGKFPAGLEHTFTFEVPESKLVPALYPESADFAAMPPVLATGFLVGLLEWVCMQAIRPGLDWPREQTVGTRIDVTHEAPTPAGMAVTARVRLIEVDGRNLRFEVEASDGVDVITRGFHERAVIYRERFDQRVREKRDQAAGSRT